MNEAYSRLKKRLRFLNIRAMTWDDVNKILKRFRINLRFYDMPDGQKGYLNIELKRVYRKKYICINARLPLFEQFFAILHELVHFFLHTTGKRKQTHNWNVAKIVDSQEEKEANTFSLIMAIPQQELIEMENTPAEDINPWYAEKLKLRKEVYDDFDSKLTKL